MDWKEAAKWIGVLVAAGLIGTAIELVIEWKITGPAVKLAAQAEARAEVERLMTLAAAKQQATVRPPTKPQAQITVQSGTAQPLQI